MKELDKSKEYKALGTPPLSRENEEKALALLEKYCNEALSTYPTSLEDDALLLKKGTIGANERNCIILRHSEKQIYWFYIHLARYAINKLRSASKKSGELSKTDLNEEDLMRASAYMKSITNFIVK